MTGYITAIFVVAVAVAGCVFVLPEWQRRTVSRGRLVAVPLLALLPTAILLYLPPPEFGDPQVWMLALVSGVVGIARGAFVGMRVDHAHGRILLARAPEAFWVMVGVLVLVLLDFFAAPVGRLDSGFVGTVEMLMVLLSFGLLGRNAAVLARSFDAPQHDL
jgi:hypothetical protein